MFILCINSKGWPYAQRLSMRPLLLSLSLFACGSAFSTYALATPLDTLTESSTKTVNSTRLNLQQALLAARNTLPELAAARQETAASAAQLQQAQSRPNPELSYSVEDWRGNSVSRSLQLNWPVETANKRALRIAAAQAGQAQAELELQQSWIDSRTLVSQAYFEALLAQRQQSLAEAALELAKKFTLSVQQRISAGKLAAAELHKAKVAENSVRLELLQVRQQSQLARLQLQNLISRSDWTELDETALDLPDLPPLAILSQSLEQSARLQKAKWEVSKRANLSALERSKRLPDLNLSLGVKQSRDSPGQQILLGLAVPLPLFDRNTGNIVEAQHREQKAAEELRVLHRQLQTELQQNHVRYLNLQQQATLLNQQVVHDATQAYQAAQLGFSHGKFSFLDVLDAQRSLFTQQALYFKTLAEGHKLYLELQRLSADQSAPDLR